MDCDLARVLILFNRPGELAVADSDALSAHLAHCPACATKASSTHSMDQTIADAMRTVPVPLTGRAGAYQRMELAAHRVWRGKLIQAACVVTSLGLVAGLITGTAGRLRPEANGYQMVVEAGRAFEAPEAETRAYFASHDLPLPPWDFDYANHLNHGRVPILGTEAPAVTFVVIPPNGRRETATAIALSPAQFRLASLEAFAQASFYNVTVLDDPAGTGLRWAVIHTTPDLVPFERQPTHPDV